jgi:glycosyltransferase involved in cell wall biosynthesis
MDLVSQAPTAASELTNSDEDPYNQPFIPTRSMGPEISVVVPMRNESPNVAELHAELSAVLDAFGRPYEILVIDDGSTDDTFAKLAALQRRNPRLRVIRFRRNFGQTAAFAAGFARARGRYIVTFDGDLQNDPTDIPAMIEKIAEGPDIVAGWRKERKDAFLNRRLPSMIANAVISFATGVKLHDYGCSLKVFRAEVVKSMKLYGEMHRFLPAIAAEQGVDIVEHVVNHRRRIHGQSKYGISRTIRVVLDLMTVKFLSSYSTRPLQMFGGVGFGMGLFGAIICAYMAYLKIVYNPGIANRPLLLLGVLLILGGINLVMTGLLGEMLSRTYHESQNKPIYVIREVLEAETSHADAVLRA